MRAFHERVRPAGAWGPVTRALGIAPRPLGWRPWLDAAAATLGIYAAIAGTGWLLFGQLGIGLAAGGAASLLLWLAVRAAVTTDPE